MVIMAIIISAIALLVSILSVFYYSAKTLESQLFKLRYHFYTELHDTIQKHFINMETYSSDDLTKLTSLSQEARFLFEQDREISNLFKNAIIRVEQSKEIFEDPVSTTSVGLSEMARWFEKMIEDEHLEKIFYKYLTIRRSPWRWCMNLFQRL